MKRISLKLLMVLLAGFLLLLPAAGGWAADNEVPVEEVADTDPIEAGLTPALSAEEASADYSGEAEEAWEEGESAQ